MDIELNILRLAFAKEVDLSTVSFEELSACPICDYELPQDVSIQRNSLITSWCSRCAHLFHRRRPTLKWLLDWYSGTWDRKEITKVKPTSTLRYSQARRKIGLRVGKLLRGGLSLFGHGEQFSAKLSSQLSGSDIFDFCQGTIGKNSTVLDIGCGYGNHLLPFNVLGAKTYGIEASTHRAEAARKLGVNAQNISVEQLSPQTFQTTFDMVISNHVMEHISEPKQFIQAARNVLKPGGWLFICIPNVNRNFLLHDFFFGLHLHAFTLKSLSHLFESHGFHIARASEDHQLRILAQWHPDSIATPLWQSSHDTSLNNLNDEAAFQTIVGRDYLNWQGRERFLKWRHGPRIVDHIFESRLDTEEQPHLSNLATIKWNGTPSLPIQFHSKTGDMPFWVK